MKGASQWQPQHFLYGPQGQLLGVYDGDTGDIREELLYFGTIPVATIRDGAVYYIHTDHLGTPRLISDRNQSVLWRWHSGPFGKSQPNQDPDGDGTDFVFNLRFPGQYYDRETQRHYNYFRYYDPSIGRYITSDPIGLAGGINTYAYVLNNPLYWVDHFGLDVWVYNFPKAGDGYGHVGLIYPNDDGTFTRYSQGSEDPDACVCEHISSWNKAKVDVKTFKKFPKKGNPRIVKIPTKKNNQIKKAIDDYIASESRYNIVSNNCADFVNDGLNAADDLDIPDRTVPNDYFENLQKMYGPKKPNNKPR